MSYYRRLTREAQDWADDLRWRAGGRFLDIAKREPGRSLTLGHGHYRSSEESWVVAAAVETLLGLGYPADHMYVELTVEPGSRPDLLVVGSEYALILEAKRGRPCPANRAQVRRYIGAVSRRWPGRKVAAFLAWPRDRSLPWPYSDRDLELEAVA